MTSARRFGRWFGCAAGLASIGCGALLGIKDVPNPDDGGIDRTVGPDGSNHDATTPEGGKPKRDGGTSPDGGAPDSRPSDGGPLDTGSTDGGSPEVGSPDGGPRDAGPPDVVTPPDVGTDASTATVSVLTYHNDNSRTGQNVAETVLTPSNVTSAKFGKLFKQSVDSYVYAQPLVVPGMTIGGKVHDVVFVVTENNSVYAFDANAAGPVLWHTNVGTALSCSDLDDCGDLVPGAGITGTPVIDPTTRTMYLVALVKDTAGFHHRLHAIDLTTGGDKLGGPVEISPTASGTGAASDAGVIVFNPQHHYQRCALLLAGGAVYVGIGGNAESDSDNHGWILGFKASDLTPTMTFCASPDDDWVSLWQTGGGPAADSAGNIYAETANGTFDVDTGGRDYGDSAIKLDATGKVLDYFTPHDQAAMSSGDIDFGSANPLLLPDQTGPVTHELIASGKPGILYLVDRDKMGHFNTTSDKIVQSVSAFPNTTGITNGIFMSPAYWNGHVYVAGIGDVLDEYTISAGLLSTTPASQTSATFSFPGATVSVSARGTSAGIVWVLDGNAGVLYAYDATSLVTELYDTTQATGGRDALGSPVKFAVPTIANGHVYVGTQTELDVYGLL